MAKQGKSIPRKLENILQENQMFYIKNDFKSFLLQIYIGYL